MTLSTIGNPPIAAFPPLADIADAFTISYYTTGLYTCKQMQTYMYSVFHTDTERDACCMLYKTNAGMKQPDMCIHAYVGRHVQSAHVHYWNTICFCLSASTTTCRNMSAQPGLASSHPI